MAADAEEQRDRENRVVLSCPAFSENKKTNIHFHCWKFIFLEH